MHRSVEEGVDMIKTPRIEAALSELRRRFRNRYPAAIFTLGIKLEPVVGFHFGVAADVSDIDDVRDLCIDKLIGILVEEDMPF
jgi:hypothetical protein